MTGAGQNILHTHYLLYKVGQVREPHNTGDDANPLVILVKETKVARVGPPNQFKTIVLKQLESPSPELQELL